MRALGAVTAQGVQAAISLALQILVAHALGIAELGRFAILYGILVLATALVSGLVGDSMVVLDRSNPQIRGGLAATLAVIVITVAALGFSATALSGFLTVGQAALFAAALAAFAVEEIVRRALMVRMRFIRVALIDGIGFLCVVAMVVLNWTTLSLSTIIMGIAVGQCVAAIAGWFLLPGEDRAPAPLRGADFRAVWRYGSWRALQQLLRPALFTAVRLLVMVAAGATAVGLLEAARTYTSPILLVVGGLSSYLFVRFAHHASATENSGAVRLREADRVVLALVAMAIVLGAIVIVLAPWLGPLAFGVQLDLNAVIGWAVYGASVALVTPYGALGAVSSRQTVVFGIRLADTVIGLAGVIVLLAVGGASDLAPYVLAVSSALGGLALRFVAARDARGEGGQDVTTALP